MAKGKRAKDQVFPFLFKAPLSLNPCWTLRRVNLVDIGNKNSSELYVSPQEYDNSRVHRELLFSQPREKTNILVEMRITFLFRELLLENLGRKLTFSQIRELLFSDENCFQKNSPRMARIFVQRELHMRKVFLVGIHRESLILIDENCHFLLFHRGELSNSRGESYIIV